MRCLYCGKPLPLLKKLTGGGEFCSDAHRHKYQEEYNKLALSRLLQAQSPAQPQQTTSGGLTPRAMRQLPPPSPRPGQRALLPPEPPPSSSSTPLPSPRIPAPQNLSTLLQGTPTPQPPPPVQPPPLTVAAAPTPAPPQPQVPKPIAAAAAFQYLPPLIDDEAAVTVEPPFGMFHIDRFQPLRPALQVKLRKSDAWLQYSGEQVLPGGLEELRIDPFDWEAALEILVEPAAIVDEEEQVYEADPPEAPAWAPPIPFAEWPIRIPELGPVEPIVFAGQVIQPVMQPEHLGIQTPPPVTVKASTQAPLSALAFAARRQVSVDKLEVRTPPHRNLLQAAVLRQWHRWRPTFVPVAAPSGLSRPLLVPQLAGTARADGYASDLMPVESAAPPNAGVKHEVIINLAALGLFD